MKKIKLAAAGLALTLALTACGANSGDGKAGFRASDKPYISINDQKISQKEFYNQYDLFAQVNAMNTKLGGQIINMFQRDYVIKEDIKEQKIEIKNEEYVAAIQTAIKNIGGDEKFQEYLNYMNTTKEVFDKNIKANLENTKHTEWYLKNHPVDDAKLKETYDQRKGELDWVDTKHILVKTIKEAEEVSKKLKDGEDFKALSDKYSIDEAAKAKGGELGKLATKNLDPLYVKAASELEKGATSEPIKTSFGYHIIVLNDKAIGMDAHKDTLSQMLSSQGHEEYIANKIKELDLKLFDAKGEEIKEEDPAGTTEEKPAETTEEKPAETTEEKPAETKETEKEGN